MADKESKVAGESSIDVEIAELTKEAEQLDIQILKQDTSSLKDKSSKNLEKEEARLKVELTKWLKSMIAKKKAESQLKPIDKRKALIIARFKAIRSKKRAYTYSNKNVEAWTEELNMIKNNPKGWIEATKNGTVSFTPGNKRKKTAKELLDNMNLDS